MQIHSIIRERRLAKHLTQEQLAECLGVTAPAVNKWEKGGSYLDITLLPPLARLLDTDLNTLLCFQTELSKEETALFLNTLSETIHQQGFAAGYALAQEKLRQYPSCGSLLCSTAMTLEGALAMYPPKDGREEEYQRQIDAFYSRAADSQDPEAREQALSQQVNRLMRKKEYAAAQCLLEKMSGPSLVDKGQLEANLLLAQGEFAKAALQMERKLLSALTEVHAALMTLMEIALKEERDQDADAIARVDSQAAQLFDLWEYNQYLPYSQLYDARKDRAGQLRMLLPMLRALTHPWEVNKSPLYRHIPQKPGEKELGARMRQVLLRTIQTEDPELVQQSPELRKLCEQEIS